MTEYTIYWATKWIGYKTWLIDNAGLTSDAMHVHGAMLILFASALILRRRADSIWCWLVVFIAELFNEYADLRGLAPGEDTLNASLHDIYNTMLWPTVIVALGWLVFPKPKKVRALVTGELSELADKSFEHPPAI
jgi:hypothetical protein